MDDPRLWLYFVSSFTGAVMVLGSVWLLYKQKIRLDRDARQMAELSTPFGALKSQTPALVLFALGFFPLVYPIYSINNLSSFARVETIRIRGPVDAHAYPALIYASVEQDARTAKGEFEVLVPYFGARQRDYKMLLVVNGQVLAEESARRKGEDGEIEVHFKPVVAEESPYEPMLAEVPADYLGGPQ